MPTKNPPRFLSPALRVIVLSALAITLFTLPAIAQKVNINYLTSDIPNVAAFGDTNLINPWGMSISPTGPWWISDNGTGLSTLYNGSGSPQTLVVTIPSAGGGHGSPTGTVYNPTSDFKINGQTAIFLFSSEDGIISGWYTGTTAFIGANNSGS